MIPVKKGSRVDVYTICEYYGIPHPEVSISDYENYRLKQLAFQSEVRTHLKRTTGKLVVTRSQGYDVVILNDAEALNEVARRQKNYHKNLRILNEQAGSINEYNLKPEDVERVDKLRSGLSREISLLKPVRKDLRGVYRPTARNTPVRE